MSVPVRLPYGELVDLLATIFRGHGCSAAVALLIAENMAGAERAATEAIALMYAREQGQEAGQRLVALSEAAEAFAVSVRIDVTTPGGVLGGGLPNYAIYAAKDGYLACGALEMHFFRRLVDAFGDAATTREGLATFATHALQVHAATGPPRRARRRFVALIGVALALGYVVSAASSLRQYYTYATPLTPRISAPLNDWAAEAFPRQFVAAPLTNHDAGRYPPRSHSRAAHVATGAAIMATL